MYKPCGELIHLFLFIVLLKLFLQSYLLNATLMTTTLEGSFEELVEDSLGSLVVDETSWKHDDIGIVVLADKLSDIFAPC